MANAQSKRRARVPGSRLKRTRLPYQTLRINALPHPRSSRPFSPRSRARPVLVLSSLPPLSPPPPPPPLPPTPPPPPPLALAPRPLARLPPNPSPLTPLLRQRPERAMAGTSMSRPELVIPLADLERGPKRAEFILSEPWLRRALEGTDATIVAPGRVDVTVT